MKTARLASEEILVLSFAAWALFLILPSAATGKSMSFIDAQD